MIDAKSTDFEIICDFGNLYEAYRRAKSGKKLNKSMVRFQRVALDGIYQLKKGLENRIYEVSPYNKLIVHEPKERIVMAAAFKDNVIQHSLCDNVLHPKLKDEFILTNYAGQVGKGTLFGLECLSTQMQLAYSKYGYDCWIVKTDIRKYFYNINHDILKDIVRYFVVDDDVYWLCEKYIDSTDGVGIPLGNQVSQIFALLYLSGLDHLVTGELGVTYYGRYTDDIYLIVQNKEYAKYCLEAITEFVEYLGLKLNEKTQIIPFKNGIKFCGFHTYVTRDGKVIRKLTNEKKRATKKKYKKKAKLVKSGRLSKEKFYESYNSWKNHISHGNCKKLGYEMDKYIDELLEE